MADGVEVELGIQSELGTADSGDLEHDLSELLVAIAEAAKEKSSSVCLIIDELQYLNKAEMSALIMALHQVSQRKLPFVMYAAGLPLILGLAGRSKSYSERLFTYPKISVLPTIAARQALEKPVEALGVTFEPAAVDAILEKTGRYPYFLQQWGYEAWNIAKSSPITLQVVLGRHRPRDRATRRQFLSGSI